MTASVLKIAGLYTSPNALSSVPEGALRRADNCVINFANTIESRRGFEFLAYTYGTSLSRADALFSYQGHVLVRYGTKLAYDSGAALTDYSGTNEPPDSTLLRMKSAEIARNFYFTTAQGVKKLDAYDGTPIGAGLPRGPVPTSPRAANVTKVTGDPGDGWFEQDGQTAYIGVIGRRDVNDNVVLGEASNPVYVVNPSDFTIQAGNATKAAGTSIVTVTRASWANVNHGYVLGSKITLNFDPADTAFPDGTYAITEIGATFIKYDDSSVSVGGATTGASATLTNGSKNVHVIFDISPELDTNHFVQVYRAKQSLTQDTPPAPDYFLVKEVQLTSGIISATEYAFDDTVPDSLLLSPYYNNTNVGYQIPDGSPDNENSRPPLTHDLEVWDDRLFGANYTERQNLIINLLAVGATEGLQVGDTITVAGITYTGVAEATPLTSTTFKVFDTLDWLPSEAVRRTAQSLALTITKHASSTVSCAYTSAEDEIPGELFIETRDAADSAFTVYVSRASAWNPEIGTDSLTALSSTADVAVNSLWFSKKDEPEAVPRLNRLIVGPRNQTLLRIKALGERLFCFTDRAIYTVSGQFPYRVDLLSKTAVLVAPDSLVDFDDALFALTTQGVVRISEAGIGIISGSIDADIKRLFGEGLPTMRVKAQAVGYESYNKYILSMPTEAADTSNTQSLVYDVKTQTWTRWNKPINAAVVVPENDYLYIVRTDGNKVSKERKTFTSWDYVDESFAVTVNSHSGTSVVLASASGVETGDLLYQSALVQSIVTAVNGNTVTLASTEAWVDGFATRAYKGIACDVLFSDQFVGAPNQGKQFREVCYHFKTPGVLGGYAYFVSEVNPSEEEVPINLAGWGDALWGDFAWAQPNGPKNRRVIVTPNASRAAFLGVGFRVTEGLGVWALYGYTVETNPMSERNSK